MIANQNIAIAVLFIPLAIIIAYMDVRYRRIPNKLVILTLVSGVTLNTVFGGAQGLRLSLAGSLLAFVLMLALHVFGTMGAGDVKLFAAIGAIIGSPLVLPALLIVALTGGLLAVAKMIHSGRVGTTMFGVFQFFYGFLPGQRVPRFEVPDDRSFTLPYGLAICGGSVIAFLLFRA